MLSLEKLDCGQDVARQFLVTVLLISKAWTLLNVEQLIICRALSPFRFVEQKASGCG
jgi:hypothetical protein